MAAGVSVEDGPVVPGFGARTGGGAEGIVVFLGKVSRGGGRRLFKGKGQVFNEEKSEDECKT